MWQTWVLCQCTQYSALTVSHVTPTGQTWRIYQRNNPDVPLCKFAVTIMPVWAQMCIQNEVWVFADAGIHVCLCSRGSSKCQNSSGILHRMRAAFGHFEELIVFFLFYIWICLSVSSFSRPNCFHKSSDFLWVKYLAFQTICICVTFYTDPFWHPV